MSTANFTGPSTESEPTESFPWRKSDIPIDARAIGLIAAIAIAFDIVFPPNAPGVGLFLFFTLTAVALLVSGRADSVQSRAMLFAVPVFAIWFAVRVSPMLMALDFLACMVLLTAASSFARNGSIFDLTVPQVVLRALGFVGHCLLAVTFLFSRPKEPGAMSRDARLWPVLRGLLIMAPVLFVLGALLASADTVFSSLLPDDLASIATHGGQLLLGAWAMTALLRAASYRLNYSVPGTRGGLGVTEGLVCLASLVCLFTVFVVTQVVTWLGGAEHVLRTANLTYAEHARSGFFQLLVVALITLCTLLTLRALVETTDHPLARWFRGLALTAIALTLVIVATAISRLFLYENAYGLTLLRFYATAFALLIGVTFVLLALSMGGVRPEKQWFLGMSAVAAFVFVLGLNVINPDALAVQRNVDRLPEVSVPFDAYYATSLSDDGVPTLVKALPKLPEGERATAETNLCNNIKTRHSGWLWANLSESRARDALKSVCR